MVISNLPNRSRISFEKITGTDPIPLLDLTSLDFANLSTTYTTSESNADATIASNEDITLFEDNDDMYNFTHDIFDSTFSSLLIADSFISPKLN